MKYIYCFARKWAIKTLKLLVNKNQAKIACTIKNLHLSYKCFPKHICNLCLTTNME